MPPPLPLLALLPLLFAGAETAAVEEDAPVLPSWLKLRSRWSLPPLSLLRLRLLRRPLLLLLLLLRLRLLLPLAVSPGRRGRLKLIEEPAVPVPLPLVL